jgi:hypothetical protein
LDIQRFRHFCKIHFQVEERAGALSDARSDAHIGVACIFLSVFYMGVLGLGSLLGLDQFLRTSKGKKLFRCGHPLVSDSTLSRSLRGFGLAGVQGMLETVYGAARRIGIERFELSHGRLRVGIIDGSGFGKLLASCFAQIGSVCLMGGLEPISKFGKELPASTRLMRRLIERFGRGWIDLVLLDGLYVAQDFLGVCLEEGQVNVLIKTQEEGLDIIQDAMGLFRHYAPYAQDIEHIQGTDVVRLRAYEVYALGGFFLKGVDVPFKVAWVQEEDLRTGQQTQFWVLCSLQKLTAGDMRERAHWRWDIENNGFKMLNALVHTKHLYAHDPHAAQAVTLILFIAGTILQLFLASLSLSQIQERFGKVKPTRGFLQGELRDSIADLPAPDT